jgi:hypothetical protein
MMKKIVMIGFVLFCTVAASFAMKWQGNAFMYGAADYTENFFSFLYNSQLSPQLLTGIELSALIKNDDKRFFFTQEAEFSVKGGNRYWKNALVYYTDKTYSLDIQADYRFLANFRFVEPFAFYVGMGASFVTRSDCYSIGKVFNYTNLRVTPFLPTVANGIRLYYKDLLRFRFHDEIGAMVGLAFYFRQDEAFDLDNVATYYFYNMFRCSCEVKLYKRIWLAAGYQNKIIAGLSCQNLTGRIFWSNMGFLGVNVELF